MILPQSAMAAVDPVAQALTPEAAFTWAHGGLKMTPEQAAMQRQQGMARSRGDYSPIQHWTQGLARVADNVMGALEARNADKQLAAGADADRALMEAMAGGGVDDTMIARALMDPNVGQGVKEFAGMEYAARRPKAVAPPRSVALSRIANDPNVPEYERAAAAAELENIANPVVNMNTPQGLAVGRQNWFLENMGGGGQASGAQPGGEPPAVLPSNFFDGEGGGGAAPDPFPGR